MRGKTRSWTKGIYKGINKGEIIVASAGESSNGRTPGFGPGYRGSSPCSPALSGIDKKSPTTQTQLVTNHTGSTCVSKFTNY